MDLLSIELINCKSRKKRKLDDIDLDWQYSDIPWYVSGLSFKKLTKTTLSWMQPHFISRIPFGSLLNTVKTGMAHTD